QMVDPGPPAERVTTHRAGQRPESSLVVEIEHRGLRRAGHAPYASPEANRCATPEPVIDRDRDLYGRARNARPRDALRRPLPRDGAGVERPPDDLVLEPGAALVEAQRLLDAGQPFAAHEVLEGAWKAAAPSERELWRGLAQFAVGLTHLSRGNPR